VRALRIPGLAVWIGTLVVAGLVAVGAEPSGAASPEAAVTGGDRVAARVDVGKAVVSLVSDAGDLRLAVAYRAAKGWFTADVEPLPDGATAAWTATDGRDAVPALSAAYGRATGSSVAVEWADGQRSETRTASDGVWLVARAGRVEARSVETHDENGRVVREDRFP
jgi:hypothetical protein